MYPTKLETPRLTLHLMDLFSPTDISNALSVYNDPTTGLGSFDITTAEQVRSRCYSTLPNRSFYTSLSPEDPTPASNLFMVHLKSTGTFIGTIKLAHLREMPFPDIGYVLLGPYRDSGYGSEAAKAALEFWRDVTGVKEMIVVTTYENLRSQAMAKKIGFVEGGKLTAYWSGGQVDVRVALVLPHMTWPQGGDGFVVNVEGSSYNSVGVKKEF